MISAPVSQGPVALPAAVGANAGSQQQQQQHSAAPVPAQQLQQLVGSTQPSAGAPYAQQDIPVSERKICGEFGPAPGTEDLLWEEMRLKFQYEELLNLKVGKYFRIIFSRYAGTFLVTSNVNRI